MESDLQMCLLAYLSGFFLWKDTCMNIHTCITQQVTYIICARTLSRLWFYISVYFTLIFLSSSHLGIFSSVIYHSQQLTWNNSEILLFKFPLLVCRIKSRMSSPVASSLVKCPVSHNIWSAQFKGPAGHYDREQQTVTIYLEIKT